MGLNLCRSLFYPTRLYSTSSGNSGDVQYGWGGSLHMPAYGNLNLNHSLNVLVAATNNASVKVTQPPRV